MRSGTTGLQSSPTSYFLPPWSQREIQNSNNQDTGNQAAIKEEIEARILSQIPHMVRQLSATPTYPEIRGLQFITKLKASHGIFHA